MFKEYYFKLMSKDLSSTDAYEIGRFILSGHANNEEIASLLTMINTIDLTGEFLHGFSNALKSYSTYFPQNDFKLIDVCGTGGDGSNTFNISTTVSLILSDFVTVAKHGNGSVTSKSGSADLLSALKIPSNTNPNTILDALNSYQYAFLFAPYMHPNMKHVMPIRRNLSMPTIFNAIGPLCHPMNLTYQVIGVYDKKLMRPMAEVLIKNNIKKGAIIHGADGLDELSTTGINEILLIENQEIKSILLDPLSYGISSASLADIKGGDSKVNADITIDILNGKKGPCTDIVALNAGFALYISEYTTSIAEGIQLVYDYLGTNNSKNKIHRLREDQWTF